jgi:hypothetical protein
MEQEIWKQVEGFPDYQISNRGRLYSHKSKRCLKHYNNNHNYPYYTLGRNNRFLVHRLVGIHFIPNPNNHPILLHKDHDPQNYSIKNLTWGTHKQNTQDSFVCGRINTTKGRTKRLETLTTFVLQSPEGEIVCVNNIKKFIRDKGFTSYFYDLIWGKRNNIKGWTTTFCPIK